MAIQPLLMKENILISMVVAVLFVFKADTKNPNINEDLLTCILQLCHHVDFFSTCVFQILNKKSAGTCFIAEAVYYPRRDNKFRNYLSTKFFTLSKRLLPFITYNCNE